MPIHFIQGDVTKPQGPKPLCIAHVVNDIGAFGAGVALAIANRWPHVKSAYHGWLGGQPTPKRGDIRYIDAEPGITVANLLAQRGLPSPSNPVPLDLQALQLCLMDLFSDAAEVGCSIHMPKIGSGFARGKWEDILGLIQSNSDKFPDVQVTIYEMVRPRLKDKLATAAAQTPFPA